MTKYPDGTFSTSGPECPYCGRKMTPDEPHYFDEDTTELDCGDCEKTFAVRIHHSTSWTCAPKTAERLPSNQGEI